MWNLKYDTNELNYETNRLPDTENRLVVAKGGGGREWEAGVSRCKLLDMEWINEVLLYSTGTYMVYPVINHNRNKYEKGYVYMYN